MQYTAERSHRSLSSILETNFVYDLVFILMSKLQ